jgi:hypothetical protein
MEKGQRIGHTCSLTVFDFMQGQCRLKKSNCCYGDLKIRSLRFTDDNLGGKQHDGSIENYFTG